MRLRWPSGDCYRSSCSCDDSAGMELPEQDFEKKEASKLQSFTS